MGLLIFPLEALDQLLGSDFAWKVGLQFGEQLLELENDAVGFLGVDFGVVVPLVNPVPELGGHEKSLQQTVHVARRSDVRQSFISFLHSVNLNFLLYNQKL